MSIINIILVDATTIIEVANVFDASSIKHVDRVTGFVESEVPRLNPDNSSCTGLTAKSVRILIHSLIRNPMPVETYLLEHISGQHSVLGSVGAALHGQHQF